MEEMDSTKVPTADAIVAHMKKAGGYLSKRDLANNTTEWVDPISINYRGYDVWELPPNGQGMAALQILQLMEGLGCQRDGFWQSGICASFFLRPRS